MKRWKYRMNANAANSGKFDRIANVTDTAPLQSKQQDSMARENPSQSQPMPQCSMKTVLKRYILEKEQQDTAFQLFVHITSITPEQRLWITHPFVFKPAFQPPKIKVYSLISIRNKGVRLGAIIRLQFTTKWTFVLCYADYLTKEAAFLWMKTIFSSLCNSERETF